MCRDELRLGNSLFEATEFGEFQEDSVSSSENVD